MNNKKTRHIGIVCNPVGPTQAEIHRKIQECFNGQQPQPVVQNKPFQFSWSHENPDKLIITNPEECDD